MRRSAIRSKAPVSGHSHEAIDWSCTYRSCRSSKVKKWVTADDGPRAGARIGDRWTRPTQVRIGVQRASPKEPPRGQRISGVDPKETSQIPQSGHDAEFEKSFELVVDELRQACATPASDEQRFEIPLHQAIQSRFLRPAPFVVDRACRCSTSLHCTALRLIPIPDEIREPRLRSTAVRHGTQRAIGVASHIFSSLVLMSAVEAVRSTVANLMLCPWMFTVSSISFPTQG